MNQQEKIANKEPLSLVPRPLSLFVLLLFISLTPVFAQTETTEANYYIVRDEVDDDYRFIQRLSWQYTDHFLRFVVVIEQLVRDQYQEMERMETEENFIEVSLAVGMYRYCVEVYDLFDDLYHTTNWREFEVLRAYQPEVSGFSPGGFYLDEDDTWVVTVRGNNLFANSVFYLVRANTIIHPISHTAERNTARLTFAENTLIPGRYDIYVKNPGGLDTYYGTFTIAYRKPIDLNISLAYFPIIPVTGFLFQDGLLEAPFRDFFSPLSGGARISFIPFKRYWGYLGAELTGSFSYLEHGRMYYATNGFFINSHISFLYQRYFLKKRFSINAALGAGVSILMDIIYEYPRGAPSEKFSGLYPSAIGSVYFAYFFNRNIFVTAGTDYIQMLTPPKDGDMPGFFRPFVSVGIQF